MPQFRFRVLTPDGRVRSGRFTGETLEEVRRQIEASGLSVLELAPLESPAAVAASLPARGRWLERVSGYWVAAALACAGLGWGLFSWCYPPPARPKPARDAVAMADQPFKAVFLASCEVSEATGDARLIYRFPEIPYQVEQSWPQSESRIQFTAARQPSYCVVELRNQKGTLATARIQPIQPSNRFSLIGCEPGVSRH